MAMQIINKALRERMARQVQGVDSELNKWINEGMEQAMSSIISSPQGEFIQGGGKVVFVIFEVANGYTANVNGTTIIGKTLSECCDAAQAEAASQAATREQDGPAMDPATVPKATTFQWKPKLAQTEHYAAQVEAYGKRPTKFAPFTTINPSFDKVFEAMTKNAAEAQEKIAYDTLVGGGMPKEMIRGVQANKPDWITKAIDWLGKHTWKI